MSSFGRSFGRSFGQSFGGLVEASTGGGGGGAGGTFVQAPVEILHRRLRSLPYALEVWGRAELSRRVVDRSPTEIAAPNLVGAQEAVLFDQQAVLGVYRPDEHLKIVDQYIVISSYSLLHKRPSQNQLIEVLVLLESL